METVIKELTEIVGTYSKKFSSVAQPDFVKKPRPEKWSSQEILGHLIDSAHNNLRRFIVGQYETNPKITYNQDFWVSSNGYQEMKQEEVIQYWKIINLQIARVLKRMPAGGYSRTADTGESHSLEWLAGDYVRHMKHHINQIIPGSFDVKYP